jgi:hypothetical protein
MSFAIMHPVDTMKTLMQADQSVPLSQRIVQQGGWRRALGKGFWPSVLGAGKKQHDNFNEGQNQDQQDQQDQQIMDSLACMFSNKVQVLKEERAWQRTNGQRTYFHDTEILPCLRYLLLSLQQ